jgi:hypothetical protein
LESDPYLKSFPAEAGVDPHYQVALVIEAEPKAHVALDTGKTELRGPVEHLSGIGKNGHVETRENFPAIFGVHNRGIVVIEAQRPVASQVVESAQRGLQVKGNNLIVIVERHIRRGVQRDDAFPVKEWNVFLDTCSRAVKRIGAQLFADVTVVIKKESRAFMGVRRQIPEVESRPAARDEKVALNIDAWGLSRPESQICRRDRVTGARADVQPQLFRITMSVDVL